MVMCIDELRRRVGLVGMHIQNYHNSEYKKTTLPDYIPKDLHGKIIIYKNESIEIRKEYHTYIFELKNESKTIKLKNVSDLVKNQMHLCGLKI